MCVEMCHFCAGSVSVLPTVLYLTIGVVREMAPKGASNLPSVVSAALQCLKILCSSPLCKDPRCSAGWIRHLRSTLASVIEFSQPGELNVHTTYVDGFMVFDVVEFSPNVLLRWFRPEEDRERSVDRHRTGRIGENMGNGELREPDKKILHLELVGLMIRSALDGSGKLQVKVTLIGQ